MEIRVYYESLEQAAHFIKPVLDKIKINGKNLDITLVKMRKCISTHNEISDILKWKNPDILITAVDDAKCAEKILFMIEFSTAVFTKDHELQRFDNYIPLLYLNFIHVKISPTDKHSQSEMGGDTDYDDELQLALVYKKTGKIIYKYEWPTEDGTLIVNNQYMSCPPEITEFEHLIRRSILNYNSEPCNWIDLTNKQDPDYNNRLQMLKDKVRNIEDVRNLKTSRTTFVAAHEITHEDSLVLKVNRFTHAMDPERGMIVYYGFIFDNLVTKFVMRDSAAWYKGINDNKIRERIQRGLDTYMDYLECFFLATTPPKEMIEEIREISQKSNIIPIHNIVHKYYERLSKPLRVIFSFSNAITIHNNEDEMVLALTFERHPVTKQYTENSPTTIKQFKWNEDALTYCIVHNVLPRNDFNLLSVSYPGAQGDRVMLVEKGQGKSQKRKYIDIIISMRHDIVSLLENKECVNKLEDDVKDLQEYKGEYKSSVVDFVNKYSDTKCTKLQIKIGAGFIRGVNTRIEQYTFMLDLDYFITIDPNSKTWKIWHHDPEPLFIHTSGTVTIPETYETSK